MKIVMRVNGASNHPKDVRVEYKGAAAMAKISMLEVELHDETGGHGSWHIRADNPDEARELRELLVPGSTVVIDTASFEVTKAVEEAPAEQ